jgi:hypothetical protein
VALELLLHLCYGGSISTVVGIQMQVDVSFRLVRNRQYLCRSFLAVRTENPHTIMRSTVDSEQMIEQGTSDSSYEKAMRVTS